MVAVTFAYFGHVIRAQNLSMIYLREESTTRETEVIQEDAGWTTSRTGRGSHWRSVRLWPETGISREFLIYSTFVIVTITVLYTLC